MRAHKYHVVISLFISFIIVILLFSGCGSNYEPDELSYVLLMGIDNGAENLLRVSYLIANPRMLAGGSESTGGGGGQSQEASVVTVVEAPSIYASMNMVNTYVGRRLTLMHVKGIIFSEAMAKDGSMCGFIPTILQFRETRGTSFLAVSKQKPEEILEKMKHPLEVNPAKYVELLATASSYTGLIPSEQLRQFYDELKVHAINPVCILVSTSDEKLPPHTGKSTWRSEGSYKAGTLIAKGGAAIEAMGSVAFSGGKMVGELNGDETIIYSMLRGKYQTAIFSIGDPLKHGEIVSTEVSSAGKPQIKIHLTDKGAVIDAKISLEANILGAASLIDYALPKNRKALEKAFEKYIKNAVEKLVKRTQNEFNSDILGFGLKARRLVLTQKQWENLNWQQLYQDASVNIEIDFKIRRTGTQLRISPIHGQR
jgi:spore germination protein KC